MYPGSCVAACQATIPSAMLTDRPLAIWNYLPGRRDVVRCGAGPLGGRAGDLL